MCMLGPAQVLSQEGIPLYALHKDYVTRIYKSVSVFIQKCGESLFLSYSELFCLLIVGVKGDCYI
jgi:hypothetical protein